MDSKTPNFWRFFYLFRLDLVTIDLDLRPHAAAVVLPFQVSTRAFMLPVATPPNAIVFGSGFIRVPQMAKAGFLLNVLGIIIVSFVAAVSVPYFLL